ncbi:MAG: S41 family peptidase, partial [Pseudohongiellaceae bacterium]
EPFEVTLTREIITARSVRYRMLEPGYAYMRIAQFAAKTGDEVESALNRLHEENDPLKGLVLDLRNNPGGVLQSSVKVVDAFLDDGLIVYTKGRLDENEMRFNADRGDPSRGVPLVVLINSGSASASEIVAGALQDHGRGIIMGSASFGKGSVQTVLPLTNDRAIKLTTALYFTPNGRSIQARGIVPDIPVERGQVTRTPARIGAYREADLSGHLEVEDEEGQTTAVPVIEPEVIVSDYQLNEALNVLKGLNILRPKAASASIAQGSADGE